MFKAARWRSDNKNRIKAVFRLQFQATQIPQPGWDTIVVSLVPLESGKPTVKSEKAAVVKGSCQWENPVYETVKFVREPKTGRINEKIYQFLVSTTGSPKVGLLAETTIDFADYAEAVKPSSVSLPLKASNSSAILHVTIQRMQDDVDGRGTEENGGTMVKPQRRTMQSQLSNCDKEGNNKDPNGISNSNAAEDNSSINGEVRMKIPSARAIVLPDESNQSLKKSSSSDTISAFGSDSSSGLYTPRENGLKDNFHQDSASLLSPLSNGDTPRKPIPNATDLVTDYGDHRRSNTEWSVSSAPDGSADGSTNNSEESGLRERHASDVSLDKLKNDIVVLARQVEVSELELQALRKQVMKERRQGEDLSRDLCNLKDERDALRRECEQLKALQKKDGDEKIIIRSQLDGEDLRSILKEIKQELNHEKNLNANLRLQLQKTQEANAELILAVRDLDDMLEQKNLEMLCINCKQMANRPVTSGDPQGKQCGNGFSHLQHSESNQRLYETISENEDEEQYALEVLVKEHDAVKEAYSLEQKIADLNSEIEIYRKDREELETQMEQLALDYEILKQQNHDISSKLEQTQLREQLRMQYECSAHLSIINDLEAHVESLETELEKQAEAFEDDLASLTRAKIEQEQRAIQLEEALRKTRWKNVNTAEQLQEELKRLSIQMSSTFNENEKLAMRALSEASELHLQNRQLEESLEKANEELGSVQNHYRIKLQELSSEKELRKKQTDQLLFKLKDKAEELENQKRSEEARHKALSEEVFKLKAEMKQLEREESDIYEQIKQKDDLEAQVDHLRTAIKEYEVLLQERTTERNMLQEKFSSAREEAKKLLEELNNMRNLEGEQESTIRTLDSELVDLRTQYSDLKHSLFEDELEKENLRKQVFHLRGDLQKKEDAITFIERRLRDNNARAATSDGAAKTTVRTKSNGSGLTPHGSKEVANLHERIKLLEAEIKLKDASLERSKDTFIKKEKELSNRIEELEKGIGELSQNSPGFDEDKLQKDNLERRQREDNPEKENDNAAKLEIKGNAHLKDAEVVKESTDSFPTDDENNGNILLRQVGDKVCMFDLNGIDKEELTSSNIGTSSKLEQEALTGYPCNQGILTEVLSEVAVLRERNESKAAELKEMQERYSEISLKFAEVEGERQQLVMTIRTLKNALKN